MNFMSDIHHLTLQGRAVLSRVLAAAQPLSPEPAINSHHRHRAVVKPRIPTLSTAFLTFLFAGLSTSAWAQISLVHVTECGSQAFPASTCSIPSTGNGNLLVVGWMSNFGGGATTIASVTDNAGNIYSEAGPAKAVDTGANFMADLWYAKNSRPGATAVTITPNPTGTTGTAVLWEFSGVDTTAPLDKTAVLNSMAATATPSGASVTTTAPGEIVISIAAIMSGLSGLVSGNSFTSDSVLNGNGWAHLITPSAGTYTAQWSSSSGTYSASSVSFKAAGSGGALNACDLNADNMVNSTDAQLATDMILGSSPCTANIDGAGVCNAVVLQRVINATMSGTCVIGNPHTVSMTWTASTSANVTGYNIYRATTSGGPYTKVNSSLMAGTSYTDSTVQSGQTYYYVATAMDNTNAESSYSNQPQAVIPNP